MIFSAGEAETLEANFILTDMTFNAAVASLHFDPLLTLTPTQAEGFTQVLMGTRPDGASVAVEFYAFRSIEGGILLVALTGHVAPDSPWLSLARVSCNPNIALSLALKEEMMKGVSAIGNTVEDRTDAMGQAKEAWNSIPGRFSPLPHEAD